MAKALAVLGWLGRAAGGLLLVLLGLFVFIHGLGRFIGWEVYEGLLHRAYGLFMLTAGGYWVGAGLLLIGGRRPPPADARRFVGGCLTLFGACFSFSFGQFLLGSEPSDPVARGWGGALLSAGALWLWTAARLLKVDGAPVADLRFFIGGNALLCTALAVSFAGVGIFIHVGTGPGTLVRAVGLVMFIIAALLLQAVAKPRQKADSDEEKRPPPDGQEEQGA